MVKGKGTETLNALLVGKEYKEALNEVIRSSAARPSDFDKKALSLLDALQWNGRAVEACEYLRQALEGTNRDQILNWRGYVYTLLRGFDEVAYNHMKANQSDGAKRRPERSRDFKLNDAEGKAPAIVTPPRKAAPGELAAARHAAKVPLVAGAAEFVPSATTLSLAHATAPPLATAPLGSTVPKAGSRSSAAPAASARGAKEAFNRSAVEFVPGRPWAAPTDAKAQFRQDAAVFVPGRPWTATGATGAPDARVGSRPWNHGAVEFVPGQAWAGPVTNSAPNARQGAAVPKSRNKQPGGSGGGLKAAAATAAPTVSDNSKAPAAAAPKELLRGLLEEALAHAAASSAQATAEGQSQSAVTAGAEPDGTRNLQECAPGDAARGLAAPEASRALGAPGAGCEAAKGTPAAVLPDVRKFIDEVCDPEVSSHRRWLLGVAVVAAAAVVSLGVVIRNGASNRFEDLKTEGHMEGPEDAESV
eukprot:CAMPEP_0170587190 /NCGR_PEP_ID=MMETSP0224-20130122/10154_1 /TAXON_ID=285029 /ORGANISM="Togula jolla, Strain CCCM 725" /LENGTH=474 /DNA_ID=CAMNT_0010910803 /DNA_START=1 /DNA_END=1423 /DNA_ORIENTATION=-